MTNHRDNIGDYDMATLVLIATDSVAPAHCAECGDYVGDFEPDFDTSDYQTCEVECTSCGSRSVASVLRLLGVI